MRNYRINFVISEELHRDFMLYCNVKGKTATSILKAYIEDCVNDNREVLNDVLEKRREMK